MTFHNPRLHTSPAERLRAHCVFAERFVSSGTMHDSASDSGVSSDTVSRGAIVGDNDTMFFYTPRVAKTKNKLSFFLKFRSKTFSKSGTIFRIQGLKFRIDVGDWGANAYHDDNSSANSTFVSLFPGNYIDDVEHVLLYTVDLSAGTHALFIDGETDSGTTTVSGDISEISLQFIGYTGTETTFYHAILFDDVIDWNDALLLSNDKWMHFLKHDTFAHWRCNQRGDDQVGNYIRSTTGVLKFGKGDEETASTFPVIDTDNEEDVLTFDSAQYLDDEITFPDEYTISCAYSDTSVDGRMPMVDVQDDSKSFLAQWCVSGTKPADNLHSIFVANRNLAELEKKHVEFKQLLDCWRFTAYGAVAQFINEGICRVALLFNCPTTLRNLADPEASTATNNGATIDTDGQLIQFGDTADYLSYPSDSEDDTAITIIVFGDLVSGAGARGMVAKGSELKFTANSDALYLNDVPCAETGLSAPTRMYAVSAVNGFKARFFRNERFIGEGGSNVTLSDSNTDDWTFGNTYAHNDNFQDSDVKAFLVFNDALTDQEIAAVYFSLEKSFTYQTPGSETDEVWFDTPGATEEINDTPGATDVANDGAFA
jgi:hypothetical protein